MEATSSPFEADWPYLVSLLPVDLESSAKSSKAFQRARGVRTAVDLLRLCFAFAASGGSFRCLAVWAAAHGIADVSDVALIKRLRNAAPWLGRLLTQMLERTVDLPEQPSEPLRVRLIDATTVSRPGSTGTDWRLHVGFDLQRLVIDHVEVTDATGGEQLGRHPAQPGEVALADRGYAHRAGIAAYATEGAFVIVRLNWQNVPLQNLHGQPFDVMGFLRALSDGCVGESVVQTAPHPSHQLPAVAGRLIAVRKSPQAAETARRKLRHAASKRGKTPLAETVEAAGYIFVFTTLPAARLPTLRVLELYRFRWQIEMAFKRYKSVLQLDAMSVKDPDLCRTFLLAKLLLTHLTELLSRQSSAFSPWGYGLPPARVALAIDTTRL